MTDYHVNPNSGFNPDRLPDLEHSLVHALDGVVQEFEMLYGLNPLESVYIALLTNIEAFTHALISAWRNQGQGPNVFIHPDVIEGLISTIQWGNEKTVELIDISKFNTEG